MQFVLFTDNLQTLSVKEALIAAKKAGFDGIDLTLRPGGHVLPENAEMGLAAARQQADGLGMAIPMATTSITSAGQRHADAVFASAAHYGIRFLKLGYWLYEPFGTIQKQLDKVRKDLEGLVRLGEKYHILPCVHIHSGPDIPNCGTLLYMLLQPYEPGKLGAYVDPMHMTVEGGLSGWEIGLDLLIPWISLVGVKNFEWVAAGRDRFGQKRFRWQFTPLADGQAPLPQFMARLQQIKYDGVVSLHSEYQGETSFRRLNTDELLEQSAKDLAYLKSLLNKQEP